MSDKERGYAHRVDIRADPQQVWRAFTEAEQLKAGVHRMPRSAPAMEAVSRQRRPGHRVRGAHRCVRAGRRLRLIYLTLPALPRTETVIVDDFILEPVPGGPSCGCWARGYRRRPNGIPSTGGCAPAGNRPSSWLKVVVERQAAPGANT